MRPPTPWTTTARLWSQRSLDQLSITRVVIAHRLSTIRHADRIIVMDQGQVKEQGNYDTLMANDGLFRSLMQRQIQ